MVNMIGTCKYWPWVQFAADEWKYSPILVKELLLSLQKRYFANSQNFSIKHLKHDVSWWYWHLKSKSATIWNIADSCDAKIFPYPEVWSIEV